MLFRFRNWKFENYVFRVSHVIVNGSNIVDRSMCNISSEMQVRQLPNKFLPLSASFMVRESDDASSVRTVRNFQAYVYYKLLFTVLFFHKELFSSFPISIHINYKIMR
jgi:hypothetical protein